MAEQPPNKLEHPCFPQPEDGSVCIWRYLDLAKFIWLLEKQQLYLSRLDSLNDPFEGSTPQFLVERLEQQLLEFLIDSQRQSLIQLHGREIGEQKLQEEIPQINQRILAYHESRIQTRKMLFVNCWHLGNSESEAMWRLYCPDNNGIAIQTSYNKLVKSVANDPELHIGKVTYIDYETQEFPAGNILYPVMHKRMSFAHENEVRLVKIKPQEHFTPQEVKRSGIVIEWPLEPTIEGIYVNPYAPEYFHDVVCSIVQRITPSLVERVLWSKMRTLPAYY
ncbi:DUF2971 domain-containing protein [Microcoleus sp.]|uniref:DUF2971 domain-containing protein n=1 Tax=Microcoleus sp. TaxID=44472 RepID=UPI00403EED07